MGKTLYIGNYVYDVAVKNFNYDESSGSYILKSGEEQIKVKQGEQITSDKNPATKDLNEILIKAESIDTARIKLGGGGRNSLEEAIQMEKTGLTSMYLDMQKGSDRIFKFLEKYQVESYFLNQRKPPVNLVLGANRDKIILKSPIDENKSITKPYEALIRATIKKADRVVMNSTKDENLSSIVMDSIGDKPIGVVVTTSYNPKYAKKKIIPYASCVFNYDEIGTIFNPIRKSLGDENTKMDDALWGLGDAIKLQKTRQNLYVTLGPNGVLAADTNGSVYHIKLMNKTIANELDNSIPRREDATNGAGDHFAAAVFKYQYEGALAITSAIEAQINAIRFIGYTGSVVREDFAIYAINPEKLERPRYDAVEHGQ